MVDFSQKATPDLGSNGIDPESNSAEISYYQKSAENTAEERGNILRLLNDDQIKIAENGFCIYGNKKCATRETWAEHIGVSYSLIPHRLKDVPGIRVINYRGNHTTVYPESVIAMFFPDHFEAGNDLPRANKEGFIFINNQKYANLKHWKGEFGIDYYNLQDKVEKSGIKPIKGKERKGRIRDFYLEDQIISILARADIRGCFKLKDEKYSTAEGWSRILKLDRRRIQRLLESESKFMMGRDIHGNQFKFYPEIIVRKHCENLIGLKKAGKDGFMVIGSKRFNTIQGWADYLKLSHDGVSDAIRGHNIKCIKGKKGRNNIFDFYSESDIRSCCADILPGMPRADKSGFFALYKRRYATVEKWAKTLNMNKELIKKRIAKNNIEATRGKNSQNHVFDFYPEDEIRALVQDHFGDFSKANKKGFIKIGGVRYGMANAWAKQFKISKTTINNKISVIAETAVKAKDYSGRIRKFHMEEDIRNCCQNTLKDVPRAGKKGFAKIGDETYSPIKTWARKVKISPIAVTSRIAADVPKIEGKDSKNRDCILYSVSELEKACADLVALPAANEKGDILNQDEQYATLKTWCKRLNLDYNTASKLIQKFDVPSIPGRVKTKKDKFYSELPIRDFAERWAEEQKKSFQELVRNNNLPKSRIGEKTKWHPGLSGDIVRIIPPEYTGIYQWIKNGAGVKLDENQIFVVLEKKNAVAALRLSELEN